jgi:hypothetical protein
VRKEKINPDMMTKVILFSFHCLCSCLLLFWPFSLSAQDNGEQHSQRAIEQLGESESFVAEDDATLQQYEQLLKNPLDINKVNREELSVFTFLSPMQVEYFLSHRKLNGFFISIYELQAIPHWDEMVIRQLLPYLCLDNTIQQKADFRKKWRSGMYQLITGVSYKIISSSSTSADQESTFLGSNERAYFRYTYQYKNLLQYGIVGEKDAGEAWFKGAQQKGFDFYSAHLALANYGKLKKLIIGDYVVNMGQGLLMWQSMAFRKSSEVMMIKRQASVIRPYHSLGEYLFQRGVAATLIHRSWVLTGFISKRQLDATIRSDSIRQEKYFSFINTSGLHRTVTEQRNMGVLPLIMMGGNLKYDKGANHIGVNMVQCDFGKILQLKEDQPYNLYSYSGRGYVNLSADASYTFKNLHLFGEYAIHKLRYPAWSSGLLMSLDAKVDFSLLYRNLAPRYQSLYGNAFIESTLPTNEKGVYMGLSVRPTHATRIDMYADYFSFPWLRYGVDAPSRGKEYMIQLNYSVKKRSNFFIRFRWQDKMTTESVVSAMYKGGLVLVKQMNVRAQMELNQSKALTVRNRVEVVGYREGFGEGKQSGFLCFMEVLYKPMLRPYAFNIRVQYFEADDYDSRVYAYEQDVMYQFSIPAFYGKGYRFYVNGKYKMGKHFTLWLRVARLWQQDKSGLEGKFQIQWQG